MSTPVDERMAELESRLAFQEDIIENLNQIVARQDREILALKQQLGNLADRVREFHDSAVAAGPSTDIELPPHY